jgi:hypothetical protein
MSTRVVAGLMLMSVACRNGGSDGTALADTTRTYSQSAQGSTEFASSSPAEAVDKDAVAALDRMSAYLRSLKAFRVRASTNSDDVLENGQKVQFATTQDVLVEKPNRMFAEVTSDGQHRVFFYDGKTFTLWADRPGYYASVPMSGTVNDLSERLQQKFAIEMPLRDLFLWGTDRSASAEITSAVDVGQTQIEGTTVEQYAFRQKGVDWQVWIQQGAYPLPRKLLITTTTDEARPDYSAMLSWDLAPSFNEASFTFDPPSTAKKITIAQTDTATARN